MQIGFLGLGNMGLLMSQNLHKHLTSQSLPPLIVHNRTASRADTIVAQGAIFESDLSRLSQRCDVIFTSLSNDDAVLAVHDALVKGLGDREVIFVDMSTIYPTTVSQLAKRLEGTKARLMSCPVFGPPMAAKSAQLVAVISGPVELHTRVKDLMVPAMARASIDLGVDPTQGAKMKLCGNFMIVGILELLAEALTLGEASGVTQVKVLELLEIIFPNPVFINYASKMANDTFSTDIGFMLSLGLKDIGHIQRLAADSSCVTPLADTAHRHMVTAKKLNRIEEGEGEGKEWDWSSLVTALRVQAGMGPFIKKLKMD